MQVCGGVRRAVVLVVGALALCAAAVQPAGASLDSCSTAPLSHPFAPWLDPGSYSLAPNGGFENGAAGWSLSGGAGVVAGNEPFDVGSPSDSSSLSLSNGSSAATSPVCVGLLDPTMRFFAKGSLLSTLRVDVLYTDASGKQRAQTIGVVLGTGVWQPTLPTLILANLAGLPLVTNGEVSVSFRFTPQGGSWQIDDVYIDPLKGS